MPAPSAERLSSQQRRLLTLYLDELERWRHQLNLSAVPRERAWSRHVGESLQLLRVAAPAQAARVADVGSGAGVPGLVLAVLRPDLRLTLLEADSRKAGFLVHAAGLLGCDGVSVESRPAEEAARDPSLRDRHDLAVSRAAAEPAAAIELCLPLVRPGGRVLLLVADAASAAGACTAVTGACGGAAPEPAAPGILSVAKLVPTPARFPRRAGLPRRRPLR